MIDEGTGTIVRSGLKCVEISVDFLKLLMETLLKEQQQKGYSNKDTESLLNKAMNKVSEKVQEQKPVTLSDIQKQGTPTSIEIQDNDVAKALQRNCKKNNLDIAFKKSIGADGKPSMYAYVTTNNAEALNSIMKQSVNEVMGQKRNELRTNCKSIEAICNNEDVKFSKEELTAPDGKTYKSDNYICEPKDPGAFKEKLNEVGFKGKDVLDKDGNKTGKIKVEPKRDKPNLKKKLEIAKNKVEKRDKNRERVKQKSKSQNQQR